jgi:hypothetical protein
MAAVPPTATSTAMAISTGPSGTCMPTILPAITDIGIKIAAKVNYARWLRAIKTGIANISLPDEHAIRADGAKFLELMNTYRIAKADDSP